MRSLLPVVLPCLGIPLAACYVIPPPGTAAPGTTQECSKWIAYSPGLTCATIEANNSITEAEFQAWNPITAEVGSSCTLIAGFDYCVQVNYGQTTTSATPSPTTFATKTTTLLPARTTTHGNGVSTPTPTQSGMVHNCNKFHDVAKGDTCETITKSAGISLSDFYTWNPGVGKGCSSLWLKYYVCVGVIGSTPKPPPTTTKPGNGIITPTPTQAGMVKNCNSFHDVKKGDTCDTIAKSAGISLSNFYTWNPGVGKDCSSLWLGYQVCTRVIGFKPTTTSGNGISTPTPTQKGMVGSCNKFHHAMKGDTCDSIAKKAGISVAQFEKWNPGVGSKCGALWLGYYFCIGVI